MKKAKIYIALSTFAQVSSQPQELLQASGLEFAVNNSGTRMTKEQMIASLDGYDGVVAGLEPYDAQVLQALPSLKCISRCGVGTDNIDLKEAHKRKIAIYNTPDAVVHPVAELTIAMIFDLLRHVSAHTQLMHQRRWEKHTGLQLAGKTIGIVGLGRIGRRVAELLLRLDCNVIAVDINLDMVWARTHGVECVDLEVLLSRSDVISLHVTALEGQTFKLSARHFEMMKRGSFLVNTARGSLVDDNALYNALHQGHLAGAALDVYHQEPYSGPFCDLPNVVLTPHVATLTQESRLEMELCAVRHVINHFEGRA